MKTELDKVLSRHDLKQRANDFSLALEFGGYSVLATWINVREDAEYRIMIAVSAPVRRGTGDKDICMLRVPSLRSVDEAYLLRDGYERIETA